jgi:DNA adenine methylase
MPARRPRTAGIVPDLTLTDPANPRSTTASPFLRWPGGKRWFVYYYSHLLPRTFNRYIEPFLGSGSVFFHVNPKQALIGDLNEDLITAYRGVQQNPAAVWRLLTRHHLKHTPDYYYEIRDNYSPRGLSEKAARIVYLNRTCFNGIYRVNKFGRFNVPVGSKANVLLDTDDFKAVATALKRVEIRESDFEPLVDEAGEGDFVFLDPPYTVRHNRNGFIKYNEKLFSWDDQERLAKAATRAAERGALVVETNASHETIERLYRKDTFRFKTVSRYSVISATNASRKEFEELVIIGKRRRKPRGVE